MLLVRPRIAGNQSNASLPDGIPIAATHTLEITIHKFGPAVTHEWYVRSAFSLDGIQCTAIEFIWDKAPCKKYPLGVSHQLLRIASANTEPQNWIQLVAANPSRYAIIIGAVLSPSAQITYTATIE